MPAYQTLTLVLWTIGLWHFISVYIEVGPVTFPFFFFSEAKMSVSFLVILRLYLTDLVDYKLMVNEMGCFGS